jgi:hypothetical protein
MMDPADLAARFRRVWNAGAGTAAPSAPDQASGQASDPGPWLTAEVHLQPAVTGQGPAVYSNTAPETKTARGTNGFPPRRAAGRGPRRRRWLPPTDPAERMAETVDPPPALYRCPHCGERHQPFPLEAGGLSAFARSILPDPKRPEPLGRSANADTASLRRDAFNPWRTGPAEEPPTPTLTLRERLAHLWAEPDQPTPTRPTPRPDPAATPGPARMTLLDVIHRLGDLPPWAQR